MDWVHPAIPIVATNSFGFRYLRHTRTMHTTRQLSGPALATAMRDSRRLTLARVNDLSAAQWNPPRQTGVNPVAWELAHLAWFAEFWILRGPHHRDAQGFAQAQHAFRFVGPDARFDSAQLAHTQRWVEPMPNRAELDGMMQGQLEACIEAIPHDSARADYQDDLLYFHRLALFHEDMHGEAFCWLRATLGYPAPTDLALPSVAARTLLTTPAGELRMGYGAQDLGFAFDNEYPARTTQLPSFAIDSAPVSAQDFAGFVNAGGYDNPLYWPKEAGVWRAQSPCEHPQRWRRNARSEWEMRWFDQWLPLLPNAPAMHLNAFEAEAYCLWAGRRLPSAAQWEHAARTHPEFVWGNSVWEWTADAFTPYPGFVPGPYQEYSAPWFGGDHRELRGGAFATHARMHNPRYRNFFQPQRSDVFAGFRTVAL
jgi:iron(II)-dependent oxidoreductase